MADEIKSIEEMSKISPAFKTNITTMKQLDKDVTKLYFSDEQDIREHLRFYEAMLYGVMMTYKRDLEKPIDTEAIDKEIDELKEKVIESALKALEKLKAERKKA